MKEVTYSRVVRVVFNDLILVQPPAIAIVKTLGKIPVVQSDEWNNFSLKKAV